MKLRSIRVRSMPGIDQPLEVGGFGDALTVLRGSNASGKSRLAHALRAVLWGSRAAGEPIFVDVTFEHDGQQVVARRDDTTVAWNDASGPRTAPVSLPEVELAGAFSVRADDVLAGGDAAGDELRRRIGRELTGNVDLGQVRDRFRVPAGNVGSKERDALRTATRTLDDVRAANLALLEREQRELPQLQRDLDAARTARERLAAIVAARAVRKLDAELVDLDRALAELPTGVDRVPVDAQEALLRYRKLASDAARELDEAVVRRDALDAERASIGAAQRLEPGELERLAELREAARTAIDARERAGSELVVAQQALGAHGEFAVVVSPAQVVIAERLATQAADARAAIAAADKATVSATRMRDVARAGAVRVPLAIEPSGSTTGAARIRRDGPTVLQVVLLGASGVVGWSAAAIIAGPGLVRLLLVLLAAVTLVVLVLARAAQRARETHDDGAASDIVPQRAELIADELLAHAAQDRADASEVLTSVRSTAVELAEQAGVQVDVDEQPSAALAAVLQQLARAGAARDAVAAAETAITVAATRCDDALTALAAACARHGIDAPTDNAGAAAAIGRIGQLDGELAGIERELATLDASTLPALRRRVAACDREVASLLEAVGLAQLARESDAVVDVALARQVAAAAAMRDLAPRIESSRRRRGELLDQLAAHEDVRELDAAELDEEHAQLEHLAAEYESIAQRVGAFENELLSATRGDEVDRCEAAQATAQLALERVRRRVLHAGAGSFLLRQVEQAWRATSQPEVVTLAARTFAAFTHNRYELEVGEADAGGLPMWHVRDVEASVTGVMSLDELSSGTRAQLLLAVRLAFVEVADRAGAIPVVIDEALATTDPERFDAVAQALAEHARTTGRQVIYLASSDDAVARIQRAVPSELVEVVDIDRARRDAQTPPVRPRPLGRVPAPGDLDPVDYAAVVGAAPLDPQGAASATSMAHVLHAEGEQVIVQRLLEARVENIGRFDRASSLDALPTGIDADKVRALVEVTMATLEQWHVGRPPALPAHELELAALDGKPVVSATYRSAVIELLASLDGNAARLVQALDDKQVKGFRAASVEALREWSEHRGFIDARPPVDEADALLHVRAALGARVERAGATPARLAEAVHHIWQLADASLSVEQPVTH